MALDVYTSTGARLTSPQLPTYVTSLPSGPIDGQEIYYAADATNGVIWHLRYRAASSSSYKWEFVGGPPLVKSVTAQAGPYSATADTSTDLSVGTGLEITPGLVGTYVMESNANLYAVTTARRFATVIRVNTTDSTDGAFVSAPADGWGFVQLSERRDVTSATHVCKPMYQCAATVTNSIYRRALTFTVTPVRVG